MPLKVYDETIRVLKSAVQSAKLGREEELGALKRLDDQARSLEQHTSSPSVDELIASELKDSHTYDGRSIFGWEAPPASNGSDAGAARRLHGQKIAGT